jgi:hypothetical protein
MIDSEKTTATIELTYCLPCRRSWVQVPSAASDKPALCERVFSFGEVRIVPEWGRFSGPPAVPFANRSSSRGGAHHDKPAPTAAASEQPVETLELIQTGAV